MSNASVSIKFRWGLTPSDPEQQPVLIVGLASHLNTLTWDDVRCKLEPRVSEEVRDNHLKPFTLDLKKNVKKEYE